jgi:DhnA family fructose-bisphosphate aldolase class Ia
MMTKMLENFFAMDGKLSVVAMDHGVLGAPDGFKNPAVTLAKVMAGDPDGILCTPNFARRFQEQFIARPKVKLIIRLDLPGTSTIPGESGTEEYLVKFSDVVEAVSLGADAVVTHLIFARENYAVLKSNMEYLGEVSRQSHQNNIPHIMEITLWGKKAPQVGKAQHDFLENACRIGFELGADIIKAPYLGERETFVTFTSNLPVPVLILGGLKMNTETEVLNLVKNAMDDGAKGIFIGRNIWQHQYPDRMIRALSGIIHQGISAQQALNILKR